MAARRLIIVLVVLFVVSIVAAALAPERRGSQTDETSTTTATTAATTTSEGTSTEGAEDPNGTADDAHRTNIRLDASTEDPPTARAAVGDQAELVVRSEEFQQLEIPAFGVTGNASPAEPARFSFILRDPGEIPILAARSGKTVASLIVKEADRSKTTGPSTATDADEERPEPAAAGPGR